MIALALLLLAAPAGAPDDPRRFEACAAKARADPAAAIKDAEAWRGAGAGWPASQCLALAYVAQERWAPAVIAFEQAAAEADLRGDGRAANLWVQAGNAAIADGDGGKARLAIDRALANPVLSPQMRGEARLDRARAGVAIGDLAGARADIDQALALVPADPFAWLLSATLARRQGDLVRARRDIAEAQTRAPGDADVSAEAARIAQTGPGPGGGGGGGGG